jgi:hypothetical protein
LELGLCDDLDFSSLFLVLFSSFFFFFRYFRERLAHDGAGKQKTGEQRENWRESHMSILEAPCRVFNRNDDCSKWISTGSVEILWTTGFWDASGLFEQRFAHILSRQLLKEAS